MVFSVARHQIGLPDNIGNKQKRVVRYAVGVHGPDKPVDRKRQITTL